MYKSDAPLPPNVRKLMEESSKPFEIALEQYNDRAIAIISASLLDNLLERLIRAFYIKDPAVKTIFKNDNILQSFYAKINIAYFSGLIPKVIYHDLKLICEIRNKFAHEVTANLSFDSTIISQRISKCEIRPKTLDDVPKHAIKFILIVQQLIDHLCGFECLLFYKKPPTLVESCKLDEIPWEELTLTKENLINIFKKGKREN